MTKPMLNNTLLIRRITTVKAIRSQTGNREVIGFRAECNHNSPPETKVYPLSQWGAIAYELAEDWALHHKCRGDYSRHSVNATMKEIAAAPMRKLQAVINPR